MKVLKLFLNCPESNRAQRRSKPNPDYKQDMRYVGKTCLCLLQNQPHICHFNLRVVSHARRAIRRHAGVTKEDNINSKSLPFGRSYHVFHLWEKGGGGGANRICSGSTELTLVMISEITLNIVSKLQDNDTKGNNTP